MEKDKSVMALAMQPFLSKFRQAVTTHLQSPTVETERQLCLTSRSAYFKFYSWAVLNSEFESSVEKILNELFEKALSNMHNAGYQKSVRERFNDFKKVCERVSQNLDPTEISSLTA